jgi:hypothetical protein
MTSSSYNPAFPTSIAAGDAIRAFVAEFYQTSDNPEKNEEWASYFLPDAILVMGPDTAKGIDGEYRPLLARIPLRQGSGNNSLSDAFRGLTVWKKFVRSA